MQNPSPSLNCFTVSLDIFPTNPGPLSEYSISIKDSLDIAGYPTVCGSPSRLEAVAAKDAICIQRLKAAGARIVGKTNVPEFLMNWDTYNEVYGVTRNPWNLEMSPGGSSGGEGAAIAAGLSRAGIGSDGGGSIRLPAALCGIVGLKPTPGRVPATGHFPKICHPGGLLGVIGPMARTVTETKLIFAVVAGHHPSDPFSVPIKPLPFPQQPRIGVFDWSVLAGKEELLPFPAQSFPNFPWERAYALWEFFFLRLSAHQIGKPTLHTANYFEMPSPTAEEILNMLAARDALRAQLLAKMEEFPFILAPVFWGEPWRCGEFPGPHVVAPLTYANILGLPALSLPIEVRHGMPYSWQLIGRPWEEEALLELAAQIEERRGNFPRPPLATLEAA